MPGTVIVTGAAGGLGQAIAERVVQDPESYHCLFTVRNKNAPRAKKLYQLDGSNAKEIRTPELDLSSLQSIRAFASDLNAKVRSGTLPPIRALILNAAVFSEKGGLKFTDDDGDKKGFEINFAVNYLANFLLTLLLLGSLDKEHGRIVYVSSWTHDAALPVNQGHKPEKLQWDPVQLAHPKEKVSPGEQADDAMRRYGASKLCQVMFMHALQKRLDKTPGLEKICILGVDPGGMLHENLNHKLSAFQRYVLAPPVRIYTRLAVNLWPNGMLRTVEKSAGDIVRAALCLEDPQLGLYPKDVYLNGSELAESAALSKDEEQQELLWKLSLQFANLDESETALGGVAGTAST
ncbi:hypothetical protein Aspvir_000096 [Aspergillus viridinutans]|uniref:Short-chain dehydrogenase n=1 Tax=Aspergillus viridinutans TaxID=75553 RepID=A0A9P3EYB8_ASPVI|nr:uncharacterized protein Aspvir_000096 [Aspergillus viridinutans]GIJ97988.1 hypothetical protein Aspvir_000096 [Aspergillus viridinutans]